MMEESRKFPFFCVLAVLSVGAIPVLGDSLNKHYGFVNQQDFYSILKSIESKLGNIDQVLIHQTSYDLRDDLTAIHKRLNTLEDKITHLQSSNAKCLENVHEEVKGNMVNVKKSIQKEVRDILTKTSCEHEDSNIILKLEKIEDELTSRDEETRTELSDIITLLEDLRTPFLSKDTYSDIDNAETIANPQVNKYNETCTLTLEELEEFKQDMYSKNEFANWTTNFLLEMKNEIQEDMNNYASKVADMNVENWESNKILGEKIKSLQKFMVQMSRRLQKNSTIDSPTTNELDEITSHMNSNFEKILSTQNLFLESCYKLQNDDSQIEFKFRNILHAIVQKLEEKVVVGRDRIENIAMLLTDHNDLVKDYILTKSYYHDAVSEQENNRKARNSLDTKTLSSTMHDISPFFPYANMKGFLQSRNEKYATFTKSKLIEAHIIETQQNWLSPQRNNLNKPTRTNPAIDLKNGYMEPTKSFLDVKTWDENEIDYYNLGNLQNLNEEVLSQRMDQDNNNTEKKLNTEKFNTTNKRLSKYNINGTIEDEDRNKIREVKGHLRHMNEIMENLINSTEDDIKEHKNMKIQDNIGTNPEINYDIVTDTINQGQYKQTTQRNSITDSIPFSGVLTEDSHFNISEDQSYSTEKQSAIP